MRQPEYARTDPVTLAVVRGGLEQIATEMDLHVIRSAMSPIISETNDCGQGIYDAQGGAIAHGRLGLPLFMANMEFAIQAVLAKAADSGGLRPGDVWIVNDPYLSGTHLNDVNVIAPHFVDGELICFLGSTGHWMDVGAAEPGGFSATARSVHQEGLLIPPVRIYDGGRLCEDVRDMILANVRLRRAMTGDLTAMTSAVRKGGERLDALLERHGTATVTACLTALGEASERQMRSHLRDLPDGTYHFADHLDNDGVVDLPLRLELTAVVDGASMIMDFAGTAPAAPGSLNLARSSTVSACYIALKHLFPDVPLNAGTFRPIEFRVPDGSVLAAEYPSAVSGYVEVLARVIDVVFGALGQALPAAAPAACFGTAGVVTVGGQGPNDGAPFVGVFPYGGGYGASLGGDGLVHGCPPASMANFSPLEAAEHRYPIRFEYFRLREGSGGAGRQRGGDGTSYAITALADCACAVLGDRADFAPYGVHGGAPGAPNRVRLSVGGLMSTPPLRSKAGHIELHAGDSVAVDSPGGGGYGEPRERPLELVQADLDAGRISSQQALEQFGVRATVTGAVAGHRSYAVERGGAVA